MTENQNFIFESIQLHVRSGFLPLEDIIEYVLEEVNDNGFGEEIDEQWVQKAVQYEYNKLIQESLTWSKPNNTEKLVASFDELCENNIIALHNAGYTIADGESEVLEIERELRNSGKSSDGYCFYHEQDLVRTILSHEPSLFISFQKVGNEDDDVTLELGRRICQVLNRHGLMTNWNMCPATRIEIIDFKWQKIFDENDRDLMDYGSIIELMVQ